MRCALHTGAGSVAAACAVDEAPGAERLTCSAHARRRGWLHKKGPNANISVWRKRYFVLSRSSHELEYFDGESALVPLGSCDLRDAVRVTGTGCARGGRLLR